LLASVGYSHACFDAHDIFDTMCSKIQLLHSSLFSLLQPLPLKHSSKVEQKEQEQFKSVPLTMQYQHLSKRLMPLSFWCSFLKSNYWSASFRKAAWKRDASEGRGRTTV